MVDKIIFFAEVISWLLTVALSSLLVLFIIYQLSVLYVPYWFGNSTSFPDYFYRVYGDDIETLNYEHFGYLATAITVCSITLKYVVPEHPWSKAKKE